MRRFRSTLVLSFVLAVLTIPIDGQLPSGLARNGGDLRVRVVTPGGRPAPRGTRVRLVSAGSPTVEGFTDDSGQVLFNGISPGTYHAVASAEGYDDTDSGSFEVDVRTMGQSLFVRLRPKSEGSELKMMGGREGTVDVSMLKAPRKAIEELRKANELMEQRKWDKAVEHLKKAIAVYPGLAAAYNNLGVAYAYLGDRGHEREMLDQALKLNDHNAAALVNRAHMAVQDHDLAGAEAFLTRATTVDPQNAQTLMVLAKVQLLSTHYESAIATAGRLHSLPHPQYAMVHYLAARALEGRKQYADAAAELRVFLQEEPSGQWSDAARTELGLLEAGSVPSAEVGVR